ncbi:uncharacterized protein LOC144622549 [Crassostrea virginica]
MRETNSLLMYSFVWALSILLGVESCSLPAEWDGEWHDSSDTERDITFTRSSNYIVGWKHTSYSDTITSWTCVDQDTSNNLLLFKSNQTVNVFGDLHRLYRCVKWEKLTDFSYSYQIYADKELNAQNHRVSVKMDSISVDISSGCTTTNGLPTAVETIVLVKKGYIQNAAQNCPTPFLGTFNYSLNDGSSTFCDGTSIWDVCSDRTQMVVNYTLCSTKQFYSSGGVAYCVYSTSVGSNYYVTVANADSTVDFSTTFRFTCYAVTTSGGYVLASDNKGACVQDQNPQSKSATGTGTLTFSLYENCAGSTASSESSSTNTVLIAGIVVGVLVMAAVVAAVVGVVLYKKKNKVRTQSRENGSERLG